MQAQDIRLTKLLGGPKQFIVPVVTHASESGGILFHLDEIDHVKAAMRIVRQAYEKVSE